jgi:hypothetical protein
MSIFGSIMSAIFHHSTQAAPAPGGSAAKPAAPGSTAAGAPAAQGAKPAATPPPASSAAPSSAPKGTVDVAEEDGSSKQALRQRPRPLPHAVEALRAAHAPEPAAEIPGTSRKPRSNPQATPPAPPPRGPQGGLASKPLKNNNAAPGVILTTLLDAPSPGG